MQLHRKIGRTVAATFGSSAAKGMTRPGRWVNSTTFGITNPSQCSTPAPQGKEMFMNRALVFVLLAFSTIAPAQLPQLKSGSTVYIEPMGGYETYLAAALVKKKVSLIVVTDKSKADYIITSNVSHNAPSTPAVVVNNSATATVNEGESPNQQAWNQGWELGSQRAAERRAAHAALGSTSVSISVVDPRSSQIVFAYSAGKAGSNQFEKTAEACAKSLKEFIEKSEKQKK